MIAFCSPIVSVVSARDFDHLSSLKVKISGLRPQPQVSYLAIEMRKIGGHGCTTVAQGSLINSI